jgi:hypothetical protein
MEVLTQDRFLSASVAVFCLPYITMVKPQVAYARCIRECYSKLQLNTKMYLCVRCHQSKKHFKLLHIWRYFTYLFVTNSTECLVCGAGCETQVSCGRFGRIDSLDKDRTNY